MEQIDYELPVGLSKTINDLARTREKAAKQKYLLDLGESLVMHLSAFLIAEYKNSGVIHLDLEKAFIKNNKNLSFGVYLSFIRESVKFLNQINKQSKIHQLLLGKNDFLEIGQFIKAYEAIKDAINNQKDVSLVEVALKKSTENAGKLNLLDFFNSFIEIRNRVAHPHKEVKGIHISWPFNEDYFDAINPFIEKALFNTITSLSEVWEFKIFTVSEFVDSNLLLESETGEITEMNFDRELNPGVKVILNPNQDLLIFDWKMLLKAGQEGIDAIKQEEDELRNKSTIEDLKIAIKSALDDNQITRDELNFFESLGKTKMNLSKSDIKSIIIEVAKTMGIEDPFPEVDQRFIELLDDAIKNKNYNEFLLRLSGQHYGIDIELFNKLFEERAYSLNVDPEEARSNKVFQFNTEEFKDFQDLMRAQQWIKGIGMFNKLSKESMYKITGDSYQIDTKEYAHRTSFKSIEKFVLGRIKKLSLSDDTIWETKPNNWQIGVMTSYAWTSIFPKNALSGKVLALNLTVYSDGYVHTGFLPDWKDYGQIENYGLLRQVFANHLKEFATDFRDELLKYPNLLIWDTNNNKGYYSFLESFEKIPWYFDYLYEFDMIQFGLTNEDVVAKPIIISESFDIVFNLFSGLFQHINIDYLNLLTNDYLIYDKENEIKEKLNQLEPIFNKYNLIKKHDKTIPQDEQVEDESIDETVDEKNDENTFIGNAKKGYIGVEFRKTLKSFPVIIDFKFKQEYFSNKIYFQIHISVAGYFEKQYHEEIEKVLIQMNAIQLSNASSYFMRSRLVIIQEIHDLENYQPNEITNQFLDEFSNLCALNSVHFLDLNPYNELLNSIQSDVEKQLDEITPNFEKLFSGKASRERNRMKGNRFVDILSSNKKHGLHSLSWGLTFENNQINALVSFKIEDSIKGIQLNELVDNFISNNKEWKLISSENSMIENASWIFNTLKESQLSASSQWNRNYCPKNANIDNPVNYWCSKENSGSPWIQFDFEDVKEVFSLKLQGAPHGKNYITEFDLHYSLDANKWEIIQGIEAINIGTDTKEITLDKSIYTKYLKIVPTKWVGYAGLRIDFYAKDISPQKNELKYLSPISNYEDLMIGLKNIENQITIFSQTFKDKVGF